MHCNTGGSSSSRYDVMIIPDCDINTNINNFGNNFAIFIYLIIAIQGRQWNH